MISRLARAARMTIVARRCVQRRLLSVVPLALAAGMFSAPPQFEPTGILRGVAFDSLTMTPMAGATVELLEPARMTVADKAGRFRLDSVPTGMRRLTFSSPELDSIGLYSFARELDVRAGEQSITLATPSFRTFYQRLCPAPARPTADSAIVFGTIYDARSGERIAGARVSFVWFGVVPDGKGMQIGELTREVTSDDAGNYGVCGLPSDIALTTMATKNNASTGRVTQSVGNARVLRRELSVSTELRADGMVDASVAATTAAVRTPIRGSAIVRGTVVDERGGKLVNALVLLPTVDRAARTDSAGRFLFTEVPAGTQELSVRQIGLGAIYRIIDVRPDAPVDVRLELPRTTELARVNVRSNRRPGMDQVGYLNRRRLGFGRYLDQKEISTRSDMESALRRVSGLEVNRTLGSLSIRTRGRLCSSPVIVIDGVPMAQPGGGSTIPLDGRSPAPLMSVPEMRIDALNPRDVVAVEFYPGTGSMPQEYQTGYNPNCGMLLIWTVFARW